jgi:hypothetical protein
MRSQEHRAVGEAATGGASVEVGGAAGVEQRFILGYGDVVALSGDFFAGAQAEPEDDLFSLAAAVLVEPATQGRRRRGLGAQGTHPAGAAFARWLSV